MKRSLLFTAKREPDLARIVFPHCPKESTLAMYQFVVIRQYILVSLSLTPKVENRLTQAFARQSTLSWTTFREIYGYILLGTSIWLLLLFRQSVHLRRIVVVDCMCCLSKSTSRFAFEFFCSRHHNIMCVLVSVVAVLRTLFSFVVLFITLSNCSLKRMRIKRYCSHTQKQHVK